MTVDSWLKGFVGKLLELTHSQWIYRCITKHHKTKGTKVLAAREDLFQEIKRLLDVGTEGVAPEDKWMLEVDIQQLQEYSLKDMQFWIHAVEAATSASSAAKKVSDGATSSWNDIIKDGKFSFLPKKVPQENMSQMIEEMERENATELQAQFFPQRVSKKRDSTGEACGGEEESEHAKTLMKENDASPKSIEANVDASVHARSTATNANSELSRAGKSGYAKKLIKENDTSPNPMEANVDASLHSCSAPPKARMVPARGSNRKRQKGKSRKAADAFVPASTVDFGALGSLIPHDETSVRHISQ